MFNIHQNKTEYELNRDTLLHRSKFTFELLEESPHHFHAGILSNHNESEWEALSGEVKLISPLALESPRTVVEVVPWGFGDHLMVIVKTIESNGTLKF